MTWKKSWIVKKAWWIIFDWKKFFVVKRNQYNDISLPKWHIDPWENAEQAALREVLEETWLECQIIWDLWVIEYLNIEGIVQVQYYAMVVKKIVTEELFPDVDEVITWNYDKIAKLLSYPTDRNIFKKWAKFFESYKKIDSK